MAAEDVRTQVKNLILKLSKEDQLLFQQVIRAEKNKLHMGKPHGINEDLQKIVRDVIK